MSQEKKTAGQRFAEKIAQNQAAKTPAPKAAVPRQKINIDPSVAAVLTGGKQTAAAAPAREQPAVGKLKANALTHMGFLGANQADHSAGANPVSAPVVQGLDANRGAALAALFGGGAAPAPVNNAPVAPSAPAVIDPNAPPPPPAPPVGAPINLAPAKIAAAPSAPTKKKWATVIPAAPGEREVPQQAFQAPTPPVAELNQQSTAAPVIAPPAAPIQPPLTTGVSQLPLQAPPAAAPVLAPPVPPFQVPVTTRVSQQPLAPPAPQVLQPQPSMAAVAAQSLMGHANLQVFAPGRINPSSVVVPPQQPISTTLLPVAQVQPLTQPSVVNASFAAPAASVSVREKKNIHNLHYELVQFATLNIGNPSPEDYRDFIQGVNENPVRYHLQSAHKDTPEANIYRAASNQVNLCDELSKVVTEIMDPKWKNSGWSLKLVVGKRPEHIKLAQTIIGKYSDLFHSSLYLVADKQEAMSKAYNIALELRENFRQNKSSSNQKDYEKWYKALDAAVLKCNTPITDQEFAEAIRAMIPKSLTK